jgi:hypothetical protein
MHIAAFLSAAATVCATMCASLMWPIECLLNVQLAQRKPGFLVIRGQNLAGWP